jgi:hypothetical protein
MALRLSLAQSHFIAEIPEDAIVQNLCNNCVCLLHVDFELIPSPIDLIAEAYCCGMFTVEAGKGTLQIWAWTPVISVTCGSLNNNRNDGLVSLGLGASCFEEEWGREGEGEGHVYDKAEGGDDANRIKTSAQNAPLPRLLNVDLTLNINVNNESSTILDHTTPQQPTPLPPQRSDNFSPADSTLPSRNALSPYLFATL